jgi:hypothetical protein
MAAAAAIGMAAKMAGGNQHQWRKAASKAISENSENNIAAHRWRNGGEKKIKINKA